VARVYKATFKCHHADGTLVEPGLHYQTDVPPLGDEPDASDVATGIWGVLGAAFTALTPSSVTIASLDVREMVLPPAIGAAGSHSIAGTGSGDNGDHKLPFGLVPIIRLKTDTSSRSARGYTTPPDPIDGGTITAGQWSTSYMTLLNAFAALLDNSFDLGSVTPTHVNPVCYSRTRHRASEDPFAFKVVNATVNPTPHWRRSRMTNP